MRTHAFLLWPCCAALALLDAGGVARAQTTAEQCPVLDLPRLPDSLVVDGDGSDWSEKGLRVTAWVESSAPPIDPALLSTEAHLGWTSQGLAVLVTVRSTLPWHESADIHRAYDADSVELFLRRGTEEWKNLVQAVIAPGMAQDHPDLRSEILDYRSPAETWSAVAARLEVARKRTADGYVLEALLPWAQIGLSGAVGTEFDFRININKVIMGRQALRLTWRGQTGDEFQHLRLAESASASVGTAAWIIQEGDRMAACVVSAATGTGRVFSVSRGSAECMRVPLIEIHGRREACVWWPAPAAGESPFAAALDGVPVTEAKAPDIATELSRDLERAALSTKWRAEDDQTKHLRIHVPAVFSGSQFPAVVIPDPVLAQKAGVEKVTVSWFGANRQPAATAGQPGRYGAVITVLRNNAAPVLTYQTCFRMPDDVKPFDLAADMLHRLGGATVPDAQTTAAIRGLGQQLADSLADHFEAAPLLAGLMEAAADGAPVSALTRDRVWWRAVRTRLETATNYRWFSLLPEDYAADPKKRWPAVVYLHGSGGELPRDYPPFEERSSDRDLIGWAKGRRLPLAVYALQASGDWEPPAVIEALDQILATDRIDPDRVVIMGFSMGGIGTWDCAVDYPERFAGAVPIGGRGHRSADCSRLVNRMSVWVFNGDRDSTTLLDDAKQVVNALTAAGGDVRLTVLPGVDHGGSQSAAFATPGLWDWVVARHRTGLASPTNDSPKRP